jgi:S1-C subfamily serine protease
MRTERIPETETPRESMGRMGRWPLIVLLIAVSLVAWRGTQDLRKGANQAQAEPRAIAPRAELLAEEKTTMALFRESSPSVVHITTLARRTDVFTFNIMEIPQGTGSGFVWDNQGHIVTNFHVLLNADAAQVTLSDHSPWDAELVGAAADQDLAVLRIEAPEDLLRPIAVGTSNDLGVGQKVFAIGNPFGLDQSLTTGVISALGREIDSPTKRTIRDVIQTDAAINPGNSGGPLLDSSGRLIGVNTAIYNPSLSYGGIGFAIPVDIVNWVVPELIRHGRITRPDLGAQLAVDGLNRELRLPGVLVLGVPPGRAAEKAGLRPTRRDARGRVLLGDIIVAIAGEPVATTNELLHALERHRVGETITITVLRGDQRVDVPITLEESPS